MRLSLRRSVLRRLVVLAALGCALLVIAPPSHAAPPVAQGWWWSAQSNALTLPGQVSGILPEQAGPAGVPENGLYVAASALAEEAVATVRFFIGADDDPESLVLTLAGEPTGTPLIRLCAVTTSWAPVQQGAWEERPEFECADNAPVGEVSSDTTTVTFDLSGLALAGMVDFGLAPGLDDTGQLATFQAPIEKPGADSLVLADGGTAPVVETTTTTTVAGATAPPTTAGIPQVPAASGGVNLTPVAAAPSGVQVSRGQGDFVAAPPVANTGPVATAPIGNVSNGTNMRTVGLVGLLALAFFYSWLTGQESREPQSLLAFGRGADGPVIDAEVLK